MKHSSLPRGVEISIAPGIDKDLIGGTVLGGTRGRFEGGGGLGCVWASLSRDGSRGVEVSFLVLTLSS
jgi:hypothetical protein